ncbi:DNA gyrase subunit A [Rickettsiales bacterium Ac37b]|nr:DNA gyrase subunit A [Rickettsiales bacterium Ac37b]
MNSNINLLKSELLPVSIEDEMKQSYLDYAMSVIISRAIPDVCDGLKPVHRRILYSMFESGCYSNRPFRKSARTVGDVIGKYHPHGDAAIYDALVRMAQEFSLRLPLIDGQGNFGSMDGDPAAAMRYTESRLAEVSHFLLDDLDKNTVDFRDNYDGSEREPTVLPAKFPNLLVNGSGGIAVGMATNIPSHNLGEVIDACCLYINNHQVTDEELMEVVHGPDFPTGGIILGKAGIKSALRTGRGSILIRGKAHIEETRENRPSIIITEIPFQVNKAKMIERIAELVREKRIEGISDLRDESNKSGVRVVIELKKDVIAEVILNQLYNYTPLQTSFGVNMLALYNNQPRVMNLRAIITAFVKFREEVITRRTRFLLVKAQSRAHLLIGLSIAVSNIDEIVAMIKAAPDPQIAKERLMERSWEADKVRSLIELVGDGSNILRDNKCYFTEEQAKAILEMRLQRLTGLEYEKISQELQKLADDIVYFREILSSRSMLLSILNSELIEIKNKYATNRRTEIQEAEYEYDMEDLIPKEDMVVTVTMGGYIKRVPLSTYRAQKRGGKGRSGVNMHEEDAIIELFVANTHTPMLFFSNLGKVYKLKVHKLVLGNPQTKGRALVNIFPLAEKEVITNLMPLPEDEEQWGQLNIMFATSKGNVRRNSLADFQSIQSNGKIAIRLDEDDKLISAVVCKEEDHILLASKEGKCLRFPVDAVRVFKSRTSDGVRGMMLGKNDLVISMSVLHGAEEPMETREEFLKIPVEVRIALANISEPLEMMHQLRLQELKLNLSSEKIREMAQREEFILTVTENGFGKRTSAYEYRVTNRGGKGILNIITSERNGKVIASFPITRSAEMILISNKGTLIRCAVSDVRIAGRSTQGVAIFRTGTEEVVVSAVQIPEDQEE